MVNNVNDALSILHEYCSNQVAYLESLFVEFDDGENHSVKEAKEEFDNCISEMIRELEKLRTQARVKSFKDFIGENL